MITNELINILTTILLENPSATQVVKNDKYRAKRVRKLAIYMLKKSARKNGIYTSEKGNGLALIYKVSENDKKTFIDLIEDLKLTYQVIGFTRILDVIKRQAYLKKQAPENTDYFYFWFFGVAKEHRVLKGEGIELKNRIFEIAKNEELPIFTETSTKKNKVVYQRFGFDITHEWNMKNGKTMWFMQKQP